MEYGKLQTELRNPRTMHIDRLDTLEMLRCIHEEDRRAVEAVGAVLPQIAPVIDRIAAGMAQGGRLIYTGCGTSGRLGVLDASECPPTYGVEPGLVIGIIAGGDRALRSAIEGAEDSRPAGRAALEPLELQPQDVVVGLSAAGGAAFVLGCVEYARERGCATVAITCNPDTPLQAACDYAIVPLTGPEAVTGSTRMKAGTAQKLILNMLSTCAMIRTGRVKENLMINVRPTNVKLHARAIRILRQLHGCTEEQAEQALTQAQKDVARASALLEGQA